MAALTWSPHAALLRDADGFAVGTTWGGTICWFPRKPSAFAAVSADGRAENVIRCGWCAGCREFDRRRLAKRIAQHYQDCRDPLWLVVIKCPLRSQSWLASKLHRTRKVKFESAIYRLGADEFAMVVRGEKPLLADVRALRGLSDSQARHSQPRARTASQARPTYQVIRVRVGRGLRAWAMVTAGLLRPRDDYGEQRNRFYHRGLPRAERESWTVETRGGLAKRRSLAPGARAWRDGVAIYPPEAWRLPRLLKQGPLNPRVSRKRGGLATVTPIASILESAFPTGARAATGASLVNRGAAEPRSSSDSSGGSLAASRPHGLRGSAYDDRLSDYAARSQRADRDGFGSGQAVLSLSGVTAFQSTDSPSSGEAGYRSSLQFGSGRAAPGAAPGRARPFTQADVDAWVARMMALKRKRDGD